MKVTNTLHSTLQSQPAPIVHQKKYSLPSQQQSSQSKGCCAQVLEAVKNIFQRCIECLMWLLCCKTTSANNTSVTSDDKASRKLAATDTKKNLSLTTPDLSSLVPSQTPAKKNIEKDQSPVTVTTVVKKPAVPAVKNYDKEKRELQELVNSAPVHPWGPELGKDLADKQIYERAERILLSIEQPLPRYEAYIRFVDCILQPALKKLNTKYPQEKGGRQALVIDPNTIDINNAPCQGAMQAYQDATRVFDSLLQVGGKCLNFTAEERLQMRPAQFRTPSPKGYLPTRLSIELMAMFAKEWEPRKDGYFTYLKNHLYWVFLGRSDVAGAIVESKYFLQEFQDNLVDFRT